MLSKFAMFRAHERTAPYSTLARICQSNAKPMREEVDKLCDYTIQTTWKYEELTVKFEREQKKVKNLEGQIRALKTQPGILTLKKEKERAMEVKRFAVLQNELDELHVKYEETVWRLLAAEAKIREMEKVKVEKAPEKGTGDVASAMSLVVAPDGFSYVKMQPGEA